jgi:hypothetical protein
MKDIEKVFRIFILSILMFFIFTILYLITWGSQGYSYPLPLGLLFILMGIMISYLIDDSIVKK